MESGNTYDDCTGEYDHDYRYEACGGVAPSPEPTMEPTSTPTESPTQAPSNAPTQSPTSEPTMSPTPAPTGSPTQQPTPAPTHVPSSFGPEQMCAAVSSKSVCKVTTGCYFGEDAEGPCTLFTGVCENITNRKTCKSAEPCVLDGHSCRSKASSTPNPTPSPTPSPTSQPTAISCDIESKSECKNTAGCTYGKKGPCHVFTLTCADITASRSVCGNTYGCVWKNSRCQDSTEISPF